MDDQARWTLLERVFHKALELDAGERAEYLQTACGGDEDLRRRVESLLGQDDLTAPVQASPFAPRIGPYEVLAKIGAGGMGEVYLALDSRLGRHVALKVLPPRFVADPERKRRLLHEARAASALNHPNIVAVHDIGTDGKIDYLVMEYVPGKPLDRLIPHNGLKPQEALAYAVQIADALACAHAAGIVHRDLKPANIVVTETGTAKVLDFGLAKLTEGPAVATLTNAGMIAGTLAYMSPEQAAGAQVDTRSDIFSFGSMLYEMTTGRRPFQRDSTAATLAAIQNDAAPRADAIAGDVTPAIAGIIERCMRKDPAERFGSAAELKAALNAVQSRPPAARKAWLPWMAVGVAALVVAAAGAVFFFSARRNPGYRQPESSTALAVIPLTTYPFNESSPAFSPDGNQVAFVWSGPKGDNYDIYVKLIGEDEAVRLTKDPLEDDAPAWSPDGRWIAFLRHLAPAAGERRDANSAVIVIPATGGPERRIAEIYTPEEFFPRMSWDASSRWVALPDRSSPSEAESLYLLSARDGDKRRLTFPLPGQLRRRGSIVLTRRPLDRVQQGDGAHSLTNCMSSG